MHRAEDHLVSVDSGRERLLLSSGDTLGLGLVRAVWPRAALSWELGDPAASEGLLPGDCPRWSAAEYPSIPLQERGLLPRFFRFEFSVKRGGVMIVFHIEGSKNPLIDD